MEARTSSDPPDWIHESTAFASHDGASTRRIESRYPEAVALQYPIGPAFVHFADAELDMRGKGRLSWK